MDPAAPLLHDFWYQAMVNDLLPVKDGVTYKYVQAVGITDDQLYIHQYRRRKGSQSSTSRRF